MERKRVVIDMDQIDLLEQRIVKATELIRSLRCERDAAQERVREAQQVLEQVREKTGDLGSKREEMRGLSDQIDLLQEERQVIRGRVTRMLEMMAGVDEGPAQVHGDH